MFMPGTINCEVCLHRFNVLLIETAPRSLWHGAETINPN